MFIQWDCLDLMSPSLSAFPPQRLARDEMPSLEICPYRLRSNMGVDWLVDLQLVTELFRGG